MNATYLYLSVSAVTQKKKFEFDKKWENRNVDTRWAMIVNIRKIGRFLKIDRTELELLNLGRLESKAWHKIRPKITRNTSKQVICSTVLAIAASAVSAGDADRRKVHFPLFYLCSFHSHKQPFNKWWWKKRETCDARTNPPVWGCFLTETPTPPGEYKQLSLPLKCT